MILTEIRPTAREASALTGADRSLLAVFRKFMTRPGEMLCFFGPQLAKHRKALARLTHQGLLIEERFRGAYSLTESGYAAMTSQGKRSGRESA
jgi:DNA-binding transcriptional regulator PaaX